MALACMESQTLPAGRQALPCRLMALAYVESQTIALPAYGFGAYSLATIFNFNTSNELCNNSLGVARALKPG